MFNATFRPFYPNLLEIKCYEKFYIDTSTLNTIINHLALISYNIDEKIKTEEQSLSKAYYYSIRAIVNSDISLRKTLMSELKKFTNKDDKNEEIYKVKYAVSDKMELIPVIKLRHTSNPNVRSIDYGIHILDIKIDYNGQLDKLQKLFLQKEKDAAEKSKKDAEEESKEDLELIKQCRESVLMFDHPKSYVNEEGDYQLCADLCGCETLLYGINGDRCKKGYIHIPFDERELGSVVRTFTLRAKTKKHFKDLYKVDPYDYIEMKKSRKALHAELRALYKVFKWRLYNAPIAVAIKSV